MASRAYKDKGDTNYNARRRYYRAAQRNMEKAEQTTGATSARYRALAKQDLQRSLDTYDQKTTQDFSKPVQDLANKLGVNLSNQRKRLKQMKGEAASKLQSKAVEKSKNRLVGAVEDAEQRRQEEARIVFNSGVGSRIIGGLVDVWHEKAVVNGKIDKKKMMQAIFDYLKVDNLADAIEVFEAQIGEVFYKDLDVDEIYETVKLTIQFKVADNTLVA